MANGLILRPPHDFEVIGPATERVVGTISLGTAQDVNAAVAAARRAFERYSRTTVAERIHLLEALIACYENRFDDLAAVISAEMGAPSAFSRDSQANSGRGHLNATLAALRAYPFEEQRGATRIVREPVGVCGFITPWNWPINQVMCKVAPALAILPYENDDEAVRIANDSPYGLAAFVWSEDLDHARRIAARLRAGMVRINGDEGDFSTPFGGYKQSGNGREWGVHGLEEFLEVNAVTGYGQ